MCLICSTKLRDMSQHWPKHTSKNWCNVQKMFLLCASLGAPNLECRLDDENPTCHLEDENPTFCLVDENPTFRLVDENPTFRLDDENPTFRLDGEKSIIPPGIVSRPWDD